MTKTRWFGAKSVAEGSAAESSDPLFAAFFRLIARSPSEKPAPARAIASPLLDSGADASWTASLRRGDDLPPCRLSILIAAGALSAMRLEPFSRESDAARRALDL
jgi:hypothetical protein